VTITHIASTEKKHRRWKLMVTPVTSRCQRCRPMSGRGL